MFTNKRYQRTLEMAENEDDPSGALIVYLVVAVFAVLAGVTIATVLYFY